MTEVIKTFTVTIVINDSILERVYNSLPVGRSAAARGRFKTSREYRRDKFQTAVIQNYVTSVGEGDRQAYVSRSMFGQLSRIAGRWFDDRES